MKGKEEFSEISNFKLSDMYYFTGYSPLLGEQNRSQTIAHASLHEQAQLEKHLDSIQE